MRFNEIYHDEMDLDALVALKNQTEEPIVVTLCGSTSKCQKAFREAELRETVAGKMVYSIGCNTKSDDDLAAMGTAIDKVGLDILHLWKIDKAQEVLILDITDEGTKHIGESTRRERDYALRTGKRVRYLSEEIDFYHDEIVR